MNDQRGTVLLEFVVSSMLIIAVLLCTVNLGMAVRDKVLTAAAAREAARTMAILSGDPDRTDSEYEARQQAKQVFKALKDEDITIRSQGNRIEVIVAYKEPAVFPAIARMIGGGEWIPLTSKAVYMKNEGTFIAETAY
ncbi:MAG: hypothetical protein HPY90_10145 [Syntrophothermus sp.]|uniref:TadE/TadG family type IV pilus assembly protein n=1 Tax=Syntrophothermus sp. TaxID=2736299 RepID=UPI00257FCEEE|nr:TadE/TadG family type IV pilus assembly protein [Syntrophothermus sp.]NSW83612.1 hypothetical protein [Syntrophothermus sp.]